MQHVLTLVAGAASPSIDDSMLERAAAALEASGAVPIARPLWLAPGRAVDLLFEAASFEAAEAAARAALGGASIDLLAQACEGRKKRLLLADMDSTIITLETLDELADFAGVRDKVAAITARSMQGELDFEAALVERVAMLKGLEAEALEASWARVAFTPGAASLVATMRRAGAFTALISGGFDFFTRRVSAKLGFDHDEANRLEVRDGRLTGKVLPPIVGREGKRKALLRLAREHGIALEATLAVGDGANDIAMIGAAGLGVAYRGKSALSAIARARIDHGDLTALLFFQGYRAEEFASQAADP